MKREEQRLMEQEEEQGWMVSQSRTELETLKYHWHQEPFFAPLLIEQQERYEVIEKKRYYFFAEVDGLLSEKQQEYRKREEELEMQRIKQLTEEEGEKMDGSTTETN